MHTGQAVEAVRPKRVLGIGVVLEATQGLAKHNVTCDNFFTRLSERLQLLPEDDAPLDRGPD